MLEFGSSSVILQVRPTITHSEVLLPGSPFEQNPCEFLEESHSLNNRENDADSR